MTPSRTPRVLAGAAMLAALVAAGLAFTSGPTPTTGRPVSDPAQVVTEQPVAQQAEQQQPTTETVVPNAVAPAAKHSPHAVNPPAANPPVAPPGQQPKPDNSGKGKGGPAGEDHKGPGH